MIPTRFLLGCAALALALTVAGCSGAAPAPAVEPELSLAAARVTEGDAGTVNAVFRVSLSVEGSATVTVSYATADGTAAAGADYRATSGTLTIRAGQTSGRITVPVLGDLLAEQDEHFTVTLRDPRNATIARAAATGTIVDDDDPAQPGTTFRDCAACPELVLVPAGSYRMGSPATETGRHADEQQRSVTIAAPFAVGVHEVTFAEWDACVAGGGCGGHRPDDSGWGRGRRPVVNVSWDDAQAYVAWLSAETGADYRLLTEAEWGIRGTRRHHHPVPHRGHHRHRPGELRRPQPALRIRRPRHLPGADHRSGIVRAERVRAARHARQRGGTGAGLLRGSVRQWRHL